MQHERKQTFNYYGWRAKSTRAICSRAPRVVKQKFADCGGKVPTHMDAAEMYGQGGEASAPTSSQSKHNNRGIANVTSIGPSSPAHNASSTKPN